MAHGSKELMASIIDKRDIKKIYDKVPVFFHGPECGPGCLCLLYPFVRQFALQLEARCSWAVQNTDSKHPLSYSFSCNNCTRIARTRFPFASSRSVTESA